MFLPPNQPRRSPLQSTTITAITCHVFPEQDYISHLRLLPQRNGFDARILENAMVNQYTGVRHRETPMDKPTRFALVCSPANQTLLPAILVKPSRCPSKNDACQFEYNPLKGGLLHTSRSRTLSGRGSVTAGGVGTSSFGGRFSEGFYPVREIAL